MTTTRTGLSGLGRGLAAFAAVAALGIALAPTAFANTPGHPGTPSAGIPVYTENFENAMGTTPVKLTDYTGGSGMTYLADPAYDGINCNGLLVSYHTPQPTANLYGCDARANNVYPALVEMAQALGGLPGGPGDAADNHAVAAYTHKGIEPADAVVFETASPITLPTTNRFITFSVDGAVRTCVMEHPELKFYLLDGSTEIPAFNSAIDPCAAGPAGSSGIVVGSFSGNHALLFNGNQIGVRLRNGSTAGANGNDFAFDNLKILDVTPQLDTAFDAPAIRPGDTSTLTFTITNTTELGEKDGWSFHTPLPTGVTTTGPATTTCTAATITAPTGATTISVTAGDIAAGTTSCTITVPVTARNAGTYTLHNYDVSVTGIDRPADAPLIVAPDAGAPLITWQAATGTGAALLIAAGIALALRRKHTHTTPTGPTAA